MGLTDLQGPAYLLKNLDFWGGYVAGLCSGIILVILLLFPYLAEKAIV